MRRCLRGLRTEVADPLPVQSLGIHLWRHCSRIRGLLAYKTVIVWLGIGVWGNFIVVVVKDVVKSLLFATRNMQEKKTRVRGYLPENAAHSHEFPCYECKEEQSHKPAYYTTDNRPNVIRLLLVNTVISSSCLLNRH